MRWYIPQLVAFLVYGVVLGGMLLLNGCATASEPKPAICDGKHRRPANPYGSVLSDPPGLTAPAGAPPKTATPIAKPPGPQSSIDPQSIELCGARA